MALISTWLVLSCLAILASAATGPTIVNPKYISSPTLSCLDIKTIIDYHNACRMKLSNGTLAGQPKAANIEKLAWDSKLADLALNYSKNMVFAHNPNRKDDRWGVGENLFLSSSTNLKRTDMEWKRAIDSWFNEYKLYTYKPTVEDITTGHYTQVIWFDTVYVGCACTLFSDSKNILYKFYVCNYGPTGNWLGEYPYAQDSGMEELEFLLSLGEITEADLIPPSGDLLCTKGQCGKLYGSTCTPK